MLSCPVNNKDVSRWHLSFLENEQNWALHEAASHPSTAVEISADDLQNFVKKIESIDDLDGRKYIVDDTLRPMTYGLVSYSAEGKNMVAIIPEYGEYRYQDLSPEIEMLQQGD